MEASNKPKDIPYYKLAMANELREKLSKGIVEFYYYKKLSPNKLTQEIRHATGTCRYDVIKNHLKRSKESPENIIAYFDLQRNEWRSFLIENLIRID